MSGLRRLVNRVASDRITTFALCAVLTAASVQSINPAVAQVANAPTSPSVALSQPTPVPATPTVAQLTFTSQTQQITATSVGTPYEPPLNPAAVARLPGEGEALPVGEWLLTPTLGLASLYNSNLYFNPTNPLKGPGLDIRPAITAEYNTGIYDTKLYGNIDSTIYPTLAYQNNTFNRGAGIIQKYSPLPDLVFTGQGDYTHNTLVNVLTNSLPAPIPSGSPPPPGTAGILAGQQFVVNPNDVYTAQATMYKEFNRAFIKLNGQIATTRYEQQPSLNYQQSTYDGIGGLWLIPQLYAFGDGIQSFANPAIGLTLNTFRARGGFGTSQIGLFQGYVYYGEQGSEAEGAGAAGGNIYGGAISYFPTRNLNMSFSVDRLTNISGITPGAALPISSALAGLPYSSAAFSVSQSVQITSLAFKSNYILSPQTATYFVGSFAPGEQIGVGPIQTWFADVGVTHKIWNDLSLTFDYRFSRFVSPTPDTSFSQHIVTLGALYSF